jgi:hypothetical protein
MPVGSGSIKGVGWYNVNYSTQSFKSVLVNAGYLTNSVDDPINILNAGTSTSAYMVADCTTGDNKVRVLMANMDTTQSQTISQQLGGISCSSGIVSSYAGTYGMDYVRLVRLD